MAQGRNYVGSGGMGLIRNSLTFRDGRTWWWQIGSSVIWGSWRQIGAYEKSRAWSALCCGRY